uniref:Uncharacterized protein n=1 Tax=Knipowitschia caucasica TaxID=637954 RepID=A0AAV2JJ58_KNICA
MGGGCGLEGGRTGPGMMMILISPGGHICPLREPHPAFQEHSSSSSSSQQPPPQTDTSTPISPITPTSVHNVS